MHKRALIVSLLILFLFIMMFVLIKLSQPSIQKQKEILKKAEIVLADGDNEIVIGINDICNDSEENFKAVLDTSTTDPAVHNYTGIQLKDLFKKYNIDLLNKKAVILSAVDGYSVAYSVKEVLLDKNVYIAYKQDGKYLESRDNGGSGPYESIIVSDTFSNRRCKWIIKIEVVE